MDNFNLRTAVRNVMEKLSGGAQKNVMQQFVKEQRQEQGLPAGGTPEQYTGGFGEVRRWQQKKPSGKDPAQTDLVTQLDKNPVPIKKASDLKKQMLAHLKQKFHGEFDESDAEAAIYWFASDNHSGQWGNLYSILSTSKFKPGPTHRSVKDEGEMASMMYDELESAFKSAKAAATLTPPGAIIPDEIKEAVGLLQIAAVNKAVNGEIMVSVLGPLTPKQIEDVLKVKSLKGMEGDGKNVKFTFGTK